MKRHILTLILLCVCTGICTIGQKAYADTLAPYCSYKIELDNGQKTFYMTLPEDESDINLPSGLYYNTDPPENIYLIGNTYFYDSDLIFSKDGTYFVNLPWTMYGNMPGFGNAISFYKDGICVKEYSYLELLDDPQNGLYTASHVMWEDYQKRSFDPETNLLYVTTLEEREFVFDITNVKITPQPARKIPLILLVVGVVCIVLAGAFIFLTIRKRRRTAPAGE